MTAPAGSAARCKLTAVAESTASIAQPLSADTFMPYIDHFYPLPAVRREKVISKTSRRAGNPMVVISIVPKEEQLITPEMVDAWDFVLRQLFVLRNVAVGKALPSVFPSPCLFNL